MAVVKFVKYTLYAAFLAVFFLFTRLLYFIPFIKAKIIKWFVNLSHLKGEQIEGCILNWVMFKEVLYATKQQIFKIASLQLPAPDAELFKIDENSNYEEDISEIETDWKADRNCPTFVPTKSTVSLRSLMRPGVPLVLNFGSCS